MVKSDGRRGYRIETLKASRSSGSHRGHAPSPGGDVEPLGPARDPPGPTRRDRANYLASTATESSSRNSSIAMRAAPTRPERSGASLTEISSVRAASGIERW